MLKQILMLIAVVTLIGFVGQPAFASDYDEVEYRDIRVEPGERDEDQDNYFTVQSNRVEIKVRNVPDAEKVFIGDLEATASGRHWIVEDFLLNTGENEILITLEGPEGITPELTIYIRFINIAAEDSSYIIADVSAEEQVIAFSGAIELYLGEENAVLDRGRNRLAEEQRVEINVYGQHFQPLLNHRPVSTLFEIRADDQDYTLFKNGQLTLRYNIDNLAAGLETLAVVWFEDYDGRPNNSVFVNLGGHIDPENNTITVPFIKSGFGFYGVYSVTGAFRDFHMHNEKLNWTSTYVKPLYAQGIMEPLFPHAGVFGLLTWDGREQPITQGEFATMLAKALALPVDELHAGYRHHNLHLTGASDPHIEAALNHGLLSGIPVGVGNVLTREQAAVMIARATELKIHNRPDIISRIVGRVFTDGTSISAWMQPHVFAVYRAEYISVEMDVEQRGRFIFAPKDLFTRPQAAETIHRILQNINEQQAE
ncbi:MAG: hypothetical protein LRZ99_04510 [Desulfotomaculum sp.]|nr:hypothetical protein [Desulfotomaculum sp.]